MHFPTTCIDHFFKYPDAVRKYANTLNFQPQPEGRWPGQRTKELHLENDTLFNYTCQKYLHNFYTTDQLKGNYRNVGYKALMYFQKVSSEYDKGWVHSDVPYVHTTIIYLTPNASLNSGTSLFRPKESEGVILSTKNNLKKRQFYLDQITGEEAEKYRLEDNGNFEETIRFSNVYNRCIGFDGSNWHSANSFAQDSKEEERLTLIIFWMEIVGPQTGLQRTQMEVF